MDFYLAKKEQLAPRMRLTRLAKKTGFERFGAEFLFMHSNDLQGLKKQERLAREIKKEFEALFDQTYFSIHAPWEPADQTLLFPESQQSKNLSHLLSFCSDFIDVVNVHVGSVGISKWDTGLKNNFDKKKEMLKGARDELERLGDFGPRVCVETLYSPDHVGNQVNFASSLPQDLLFLSKSKNIGITLDTAHVGLAIESCRFMLRHEKLLTGFFEEEWKSIQTVAKKRFSAFEEFENKLWHVHLNGYQTNKGRHSGSGKDGLPLEKEKKATAELLGLMQRLAENTNKKQVGVTLEIQESNYQKLVNAEKTIRTIGAYYGLEN